VKAEWLRLECLVLLDSCESLFCRSLIDEAQQDSLQAMLMDVLDAIALMPDELTRCAIEQAQDRLLDEVLAHQCPSVGTVTPAIFG
jgi:hypothetical protein